MPRGSEVILEARKHLGTPFHHQGRLPGVGLDCGGLLVVTFRALGVRVSDREAYSLRADGSLKPFLEDQTDPIDFAAKRPGDILLFAVAPGSDRSQHLAFLSTVDPDTMLHAYCDGQSLVGSVVETSLDQPWLDRLLGVYRHPEVRD